MLADEINRAKLRDQIAAFERNESILRDEIVATLGTERPLGNEARNLAAPFVRWCNERGARYCPSKPATVAAFVLTEKMDADHLLRCLEAVAATHNEHRLANPVATAIVARALERVITVEPPRSWPKDDKAAFLLLPADIQSIIARRERERDRWLRHAQTDAAKKRQPDAAEKNVETKGTENAEAA